MCAIFCWWLDSVRRHKSSTEVSLASPNFAASFQRALQRQRLQIELEQQHAQQQQQHQQQRLMHSASSLGGSASVQ